MSTAEYYWLKDAEGGTAMATPLIVRGRVSICVAGSDTFRADLDPFQARLLAKMLTEAAEEAEAIQQRA